MTQHTPAPWEVKEADNHGINGSSNYEIFRQIPEITSDDGSPDFEIIAEGVAEKANAHLIAAAPELLEALEAMLENCHDQYESYFDGKDCELHPHVKLAVDAIKKATGE